MEREQAQAVWLIIGQHGLEVLNDATVFRGLLYDYFPEARNRGTELLVQSVRLGLARRIALSPGKQVEHHEWQEMLGLLQQQAGTSRQEAESLAGFWLNYAGKTVIAPVATSAATPGGTSAAAPGGTTAPAASAVKQAKGGWRRMLLAFSGLAAVFATALYLQMPEWLAKPLAAGVAIYILNRVR